MPGGTPAAAVLRYWSNVIAQPGDCTLCGGEAQALPRAAVEAQGTESHCDTISYRYSNVAKGEGKMDKANFPKR
jgi:hypothetical protein